MDEINEVLTRGVAEVLPSKEALAKLMSERKITLYQGFDPSSPLLHLGNLAGMRKLAKFQKMGHKVIFLIGDFTGMIGDPTDKLAARKQLTREEVEKNSKYWKELAARVLDFEGPNKAEFKHNSEWLDKISFKDLIGITSKLTVQQMLERDMFQERLKVNAPIYLHEFLYPVAQGIDSVEMDVDLEIGGTDQLFNMLAGRTLMKALKGKEKFVLTIKLLEDSSGKKMGKTEGNAVNLTDSSEEVFGKIMALADGFIERGLEMLTDLPTNLGEAEGPLKAKKKLAYEVVAQLHGEPKAKEAQEKFESTFQERKPEFETEIASKETLADTIAQISSVRTISQAKRLISQGAVDVSGETVKDSNYRPRKGEEIKVGKKEFVKIK
jgi:tyrosyl-tRNA synthetase